MKIQRIPMLAGAFGLTMASIACGGSATPAATTSGGAPYQVVLVGDLSGSQASNTGTSTYGEQAYFGMVNSKGGVNGHKVEVTALDSQTKPDAAAAACQKAVDLTPSISRMGGYSGEVPPTIPITTRARIPAIYSGGAPDSISYPGQPYLYSGIATAYQMALGEAAMAQRIAKERNISNPKVAVTGPDTAYSSDWEKAVVNLAGKFGYTVVSASLQPLTATDFTSDGAKIAAAHPDIIIADQIENFIPTVVSTLAANGVKVPILNFFGGDSPALFDRFQNPDYYAFRFAPFPSDPTLKDLQAASSAAGVTQYETKQFFTVGWNAAAVTVDALKRCGSPCSGDKMNTALQSTNLTLAPYAFGPIKLDKNRHYLIGSMQPYHAVNGQVVAAGAPIDVSAPPG